MTGGTALSVGSDGADASRTPRAEIVRSPRWFTWMWLAPLAALVAVGVLVYQAAQASGVVVKITFADGHGIREGDPVTFRGVEVGRVVAVKLGDELAGVVVEAELRPDAAALAAEESVFWIVRPEVTLQKVSGLETLFGPRYIEVARGPPDRKPMQEFTGAAGPPIDDTREPGVLPLTLRTLRGGSLGEGAAVWYRDVRVGRLVNVRLADDATAVLATAVIEHRYKDLVRANSRFWVSSGIGVDFGLFGGLSVKTESLESALVGGVSFATPTRPGEPVPAGTMFDLAEKADDEWLKWSPTIQLGK